MPTNYSRRGERLARLMYDLKSMAENADADGMAATAADLRAAMHSVKKASKAYFDRATPRT